MKTSHQKLPNRNKISIHLFPTRANMGRPYFYSSRSPDAATGPLMTSRKHPRQPATARLTPYDINRVGRFHCEVLWNSL